MSCKRNHGSYRHILQTCLLEGSLAFNEQVHAFTICTNGHRLYRHLLESEAGRSTGLSLLVQFPPKDWGSALPLQQAASAEQGGAQQEPQQLSVLSLLRLCMVSSSSQSLTACDTSSFQRQCNYKIPLDSRISEEAIQCSGALQTPFAMARLTRSSEIAGGQCTCCGPPCRPPPCRRSPGPPSCCSTTCWRSLPPISSRCAPPLRCGSVSRAAADLGTRSRRRS